MINQIKVFFLKDEKYIFSATDFFSFFKYDRRDSFVRFLSNEKFFGDVIIRHFSKIKKKSGKEPYFTRELFLKTVKNRRKDIYPVVEEFFLAYKKQQLQEQMVFLESKGKVYRFDLESFHTKVSGVFYNYSLNTYNLAVYIGLCPYDLFKFSSSEFLHKIDNWKTGFINNYTSDRRPPIPYASFNSERHEVRYLFLHLIKKILSDYTITNLQHKLLKTYYTLIFNLLTKQLDIDTKKKEKETRRKRTKLKRDKKKIKPIYYKAAKLCHPDISSNGKIFKILNNA